MQSLWDLADNYDGWAVRDEFIVKEIMNNVDALPAGIRDAQLLQASLLAEEARSLRERAAKLRVGGACGRQGITLSSGGRA